MVNTAAEDAATVSKLLRESNLQPAAMEMFVEGLPHATSVKASEARHRLQEQFVVLAQEAVLKLQREANESGERLEAEVEAEKQRAKELSTKEEVAQKGAEVAMAAVQDEEKQLSACMAALEQTKAELAEAEQRKGHVLEAWAHIENQKNEVTSLLEGPFRMLSEGGWQDEDLRDTALASVMGHLGAAKAEPALVEAAEKALACRPESRFAFDLLTVAHVQEAMQETADALDKRLEARRLERDDAVAEALGLAALAERQTQEAVTQRGRLTDAKISLQDALSLKQEAAADSAKLSEAIRQRLAEQVLHADKAKLIDAAVGAAERMVTFSYSDAAAGGS